MWYPPPIYSHRRATATGPGAVIDIGTSDEEGYPPVLILNIEGSDTEEVVINGNCTYLPNTIGDTWAECRSQVSSELTIDERGVVSSTVSPNQFPPPDLIFSIARSIMQFDTSVLAGETIVGVKMELLTQNNADLRNVICHILDQGTVVGPYPFLASDYSLVGTTSYGSVNVVTQASPDPLWVSFDLSDTIIPTLNLAGNTILCAREAHDLNDIQPETEPEGQALYRLFWFGVGDEPFCRLRVTVVV